MGQICFKWFLLKYHSQMKRIVDIGLYNMLKNVCIWLHILQRGMFHTLVVGLIWIMSHLVRVKYDKSHATYNNNHPRYNDVIMGTIASQITILTIVYSTVYWDADQKKTSKLRVTGLCAENSPGTGAPPAQMASDAENVSIWWRHDAQASPYIVLRIINMYRPYAPKVFERYEDHMQNIHIQTRADRRIAS